MKWQHSDRSKIDYDSLQQKIRKAFDKQVRFLADNLQHPSLHAKKLVAKKEHDLPLDIF